MNRYKVWLMPCLSAEVYANSLEEANLKASSMPIEDFHEHTDMSEISVELDDSI